ncbi:Centrosomal and chromosomal factor [Eumeta japonica]|uniref:Centrosomal and chromosomal factor n=1 Tax=Eumeta variegata TaxID=151549 RepID=A0A4C1THF1_EUMVA|nr:Centrosomal and chromosomal factor [Eumeta japonica]
MRFEAPVVLSPAPQAAMTGYARGEADFAAERFRRDARPASLAHKDYSVPLHVDCSIEYELPDCAKPPQGVKIEPLLMIHPAHFRRLESLRRVPFVNNLPRTAEPAAARTARARPAPRRCCRAAPAPPAPAPAPAAAAEYRLLLDELLHEARAPLDWAPQAPAAPAPAQHLRRMEYGSCPNTGSGTGKARGVRHKPLAHPYLAATGAPDVPVGLDCDSVQAVQAAASHALERFDKRRGLHQLPIYM